MAGGAASSMGEHAGIDQSLHDQNAVGAVSVCSLEVAN